MQPRSGGVLWRTFLLLKEHLNTSFLLGGAMLKFEGLVFGRYKLEEAPYDKHSQDFGGKTVGRRTWQRAW